jgi:hypothetical protein
VIEAEPDVDGIGALGAYRIATARSSAAGRCDGANEPDGAERRRRTKNSQLRT